MKKIEQLKNVLALCTIVGLSAWIGYLLSLNEQKAITIEMYDKYIDSCNVINTSVHEADSITISQMPPVEYLDFLKRNKK